MVYKLINEINQKFYIGYTSKSLSVRFKGHVRSSAEGSLTYIHKAMRKYGVENFKISSLQEGGSFFDEKNWIEKLNPAYNLTKGGEGGDTSSSENFKKGMKLWHSRRTKEQYATYGMKGKQKTVESKAKMSNSMSQCWDKMKPEERKRRGELITGSLNGMFGKVPSNAIPVEISGHTYPSLTEARRKTNLTIKQIKDLQTNE